MSTSDQPPHYTSPPTHLPLYTPSPCATERRVLHSEPASPTDPLTSDPFRPCPFTYKSDHFEVDLGRFPRALPHAAYGRNGVVEGVVRFTKKCTHVCQVTVKLGGFITTTASEYSAVAISGMDKTPLVTLSASLAFPHGSQGGSFDIPADSRYPFSLPFPSYIAGSMGALPPSFAAIHPGVSTEVAYHVQVDIVRKGAFRRHEVRKIPVLYLPKTRALVAAVPEFPRVRLGALPDDVGTAALVPAFPSGEEAHQPKVTDLPSIHLFFPVPKCFASGDTIPLAIGIRCAASPALAKLYTTSVCIQLVKRRRIWVARGQQVSMRETLLATAVPSGRVECSQGEGYLSYRLEAGAAGRESSWAVQGVLETSYLIRVVVQPPQDVRHLPTFRLDEPIRLNTDAADTLETEELTGEASMPALGLTTLRSTDPHAYALERRSTYYAAALSSR